MERIRRWVCRNEDGPLTRPWNCLTLELRKLLLFRIFVADAQGYRKMETLEEAHRWEVVAASAAADDAQAVLVFADASAFASVDSTPIVVGVGGRWTRIGG